MSKLSKAIRIPVHPLLLVAFFVLHNYQRYFGLVSSKVAWQVFFTSTAFFLAVFLIFLWLTRTVSKSSLLTTFTAIAFLFFGDIKDALSVIPFLSKYIIILPALMLLLGSLFYLVRKKNELASLHIFFNLFFLVCIMIAVSDRAGSKEIINRHSMVDEQNIGDLTHGKRPDIYYLLFDSYPGAATLRQYMNFDNSSFADSLGTAGFRVLKKPSSNYNRTVFSMASLLNFQYLNEGKNFSPIGPRHYNQALLTIKRSAVLQTLRKAGYKFYNLSIFTIGDEKAFREETFLNLPEETMLTYNTLPVRFRKDLLFHFISGRYSSPFMRRVFGTGNLKFSEQEIGKKAFNSQVIDSVTRIPLQPGGEPKFVYAHFYLPHPPFFYNETGESLPMEQAVNEQVLKNKDEFISYLKYTNKVIYNVVSQIQRSTANKAVIVLQSDHGYTDFEGRPSEMATVFDNFSAFYFPDRNYSKLYDSMSNVNTFPVIFNSFLGTAIPLKKDTSIFLSY